MKSKEAIIRAGNLLWNLKENTADTLQIQRMFEPPMIIARSDFFQLAAVYLHARSELDYVKEYYNGQAITLRSENLNDITLIIKYDGMETIMITANDFSIFLDLMTFDIMIDDLYDAVNKFVSWVGFNARNYDPAFLNIMLAQELPYICGEEIRNMYLADLLVPHVPYQPDVPETVTLEECVRVNSLRNLVDLDSFNRRDSNHHGQSNSMRLNSILSMVKKYGYPHNEEYITIYSTSNLVVDGWHRAACLYYLYGNIVVPVKIIHLNKR